jgi:hypothetical protein
VQSGHPGGTANLERQGQDPEARIKRLKDTLK